jgi:hypothetical protein
VIATHDGKVPPIGDGHGSYALTIHESFHGIDAQGGKLSNDPTFGAAWKADFDKLSPYLQQAGGAGLEETFAEVAARYYGGDPKLKTDLPHLYAYFEENNDRLFPPK